LPTINASNPDPVETSLTKTGETENQSRRDNCVTSGSADDKEKGVPEPGTARRRIQKDEQECLASHRFA
jgi:hypothetical protein